MSQAEPPAIASTIGGVCRRTDCPVHQGGLPCVLNHPEVLDCPEFEPAEEQAQSRATIATLHKGAVASSEAPSDARGRRPVPVGEATIALPAAEALTADEATAILQARVAIVALPIGRLRVGKTTLIAALYESLCLGPVSGYRFAGSQSLLGLEAVCHESNFRSGLALPDTPRTPKGHARMFLHFRVQEVEGDSRPVHDLLLADVSGEHLEDLVRFNDPGPLGMLLNRTACVALLIDGAGLADLQSRYPTITEARTDLRTMVERFPAISSVNVFAVITKWDRCVGMADIDAVVARLEAELKSVVNELRVIKTAARPDRGVDLPEHWGAGDLLLAVLRDPHARQENVVHVEPTSPDSRFRAGSPLLTKLMRASPIR